MAETIAPKGSDDEHAKALRDVIFAVGRSVLLYQQIEVLLKTVLLHLKGTNGHVGDDPFAEMKRLLESRETMGPLAERLKKSIEVTHLDGFAAYLEQIIKNRNELIHSFVRLLFGNLATTASCGEALPYLKTRHSYSLPLMELLRQFLKAFIELLDDSSLAFQDWQA